ncbi:PQQ-dependent sugar dehydrogenase [Candidatus Woesebacteria bacterium]|nr:PQQ-dependent sugar dehydrogenase [Candidatus Woesebacteria bacterium]
MRRFLLLLCVALTVAAGAYLFTRTRTPLFVQSKVSIATPTYKGAGSIRAEVSIFDEVAQVTQIDVSPDGNYMLVGTLGGTVWVYQRVDGVFRRQSEPFFVLKTSQPGFPPEEAGLTGVAYGSDFEKSGDVFLLYSFAFEKKSFRNRVTRVQFTKRGDRVVGINPQQIFEANTAGTGSHQIQDGVGVMVAGKPHLLFTVGEGFVGERALDPTKEAGKVMLVQRDGKEPMGVRPYPESPKVQALGIRNAPAIGINPKNGKVAIGDTGPNNYDRFLYGTVFDTAGFNIQKLSFNWNGTEESLKKSAPDLYDAGKEMVLHRWVPTETAVNIAFYENTTLTKLKDNQQYVLVVLFGRTGEKNNTPGKKIMLGTLEEGRQNRLLLSPLIDRAAIGEGQLGHPIGLGVDRSTGDIYFGDIMEGRIYKVSLK